MKNARERVRMTTSKGDVPVAEAREGVPERLGTQRGRWRTWNRTCGSGTRGCGLSGSSTTTGTRTALAGCTRCTAGPSCRRCGCAASGALSCSTRRPWWRARAGSARTGWARSSRPRDSGEGPRRPWFGRSGWERARLPCGWTWGGAWCACDTTTRAWWCRCPGTRRA